MGFNCLKATKPLGEGTLLFTSKLPLILSLPKKVAANYLNSQVLITNSGVMFCAIWYHLYNLKNVRNTHGGVLPLVKATLY